MKDIKDAAREFIHPINLNEDQLAHAINRAILEGQYRVAYGDAAWKEALTKARTEYNFGSRAVKW